MAPLVHLTTVSEHMAKVNPQLFESKVSEADRENDDEGVHNRDELAATSAEEAPAVVFPRSPASESKLLRSFSSLGKVTPKSKPQRPKVEHTSAAASATSAAPATVGPSDSVSQAGSAADVDDEDLETDVKFRSMGSLQTLGVLKEKLPLAALLRGDKLGRSERAVRAYLTNGRLQEMEIKLLRNYLKQVASMGMYGSG